MQHAVPRPHFIPEHRTTSRTSPTYLSFSIRGQTSALAKQHIVLFLSMCLICTNLSSGVHLKKIKYWSLYPLQQSPFTTKWPHHFETKEGARKCVIPDPGHTTKFPFFSSKLRRGVAVWEADQGMFQPPVPQPLAAPLPLLWLVPWSQSPPWIITACYSFWDCCWSVVMLLVFWIFWEGSGSIDKEGFNLGPPVAAFFGVFDVFTETLNNSVESVQLDVLRAICCDGNLSVIFTAGFYHAQHNQSNLEVTW